MNVSEQINYLLRKYDLFFQNMTHSNRIIYLLQTYEKLFQEYESYELEAKIGAGIVVETMCGATLRGARRSGPGWPWAQYINRYGK